jgi:hypothetical protein
MKKWGLLRFRRRALPDRVSTPEFGVRLVLKTGDKVVLRDTRGSIHILTIHDGGSSQGRRPERGGEQSPHPDLA